MDTSPGNDASEVPTIPSELIEDDILAANQEQKQPKTAFKKQSDSSPLVQEELFQSPKRVSKDEHKANVNNIGSPKTSFKKQPELSTLVREEIFQSPKRVSKDDQKSNVNSIGSPDIEEDIIMQNAMKASKSRSSTRRSEPYPKELVNGITSQRKALDGPSRGSIFTKSDSSQKQQIQTLKRFIGTLSSFSSTPLTQELYDQEIDTFQMNLCIERDLFTRPLKRDPAASHLKPLSKSSLTVANAIDDPRSVKRAFFNQQRQWRTMRPLEALAGGFYARSSIGLSHLENRNMSGRVQRMASICAKQFALKMHDTCPSDEMRQKLKEDIEASLVYTKLEDTGQQIYRQMTQYMNFLAGSKAVIKAKNQVSSDKLTSKKLKSRDILGSMSREKNIQQNSGSTDRSATLKRTGGADSVTFASNDIITAKSVREKEKRNASIMDIPMPATSSASSNLINIKSKPLETPSAKEDGELSDNADVIEQSPMTPEARDVTENEEPPFQIEIHPKKQSGNEDSSDHDSDAGSKKKKKKRKKSKSSSSKKERKKKKKEKKAKDDKSEDDLPKAYAVNRNQEDRPHRMFIPRGQHRPPFRRGGFYPYPNRGGFRGGFRPHNFRFRGGGRGGNFHYNPMNRNYNPRFQRPGGSLYQRVREKRFVSESSSDEDSSKRRKRSRTTSGRRSPSVTPKREIVVSDKSKAGSASKSARGSKDKGDDSDEDASALNMLNEYV